MIDRLPPPLLDRREGRDIARGASVPGDFAGLLVRGTGPGGGFEPAPAFNRERRGASSAVSFAAMPVVGPVAVQSPASADHTAQSRAGAPIERGSRPLPESPGTQLPAAPAIEAARVESRWVESGAAIGRHSIVAARASPENPCRSAPFEPAMSLVAGARPDAATRNPLEHRVPGLGRAPPAQPESAAATDFAVHLFVIGEPRVVVRGVGLSAQERSEAITRIVKLMRSYGHKISEQSIELEGVET